MKFKLSWVITALVLLGTPHYARAIPIVVGVAEEGTILDTGGVTYEFFVAGGDPLDYIVTLSDLEDPVAFATLAVAITTSTDTLMTLPAPGTSTFTADIPPGRLHFANVFGEAGEVIGAENEGRYRIIIEAETASVPEPATVLLIGTGLAGLVAFRRKFKS